MLSFTSVVQSIGDRILGVEDFHQVWATMILCFKIYKRKFLVFGPLFFTIRCGRWAMMILCLRIYRRGRFIFLELCFSHTSEVVWLHFSASKKRIYLCFGSPKSLIFGSVLEQRGGKYFTFVFNRTRAHFCAFSSQKMELDLSTPHQPSQA